MKIQELEEKFKKLEEKTNKLVGGKILNGQILTVEKIKVEHKRIIIMKDQGNQEINGENS